jgi:hypothetical protein
MENNNNDDEYSFNKIADIYTFLEKNGIKSKED